MAMKFTRKSFLYIPFWKKNSKMALMKSLQLLSFSYEPDLNLTPWIFFSWMSSFRSSHPEVFLGKGVLKICSKFTGEHPCRSAISCTFIEIAFWHGCSPVNLLHISRTPYSKNTSGWLVLNRKNRFCNWKKWTPGK